MKRLAFAIAVLGLLAAPAAARAEDAHHAEVAATQKLTGEVVDVVCYLSHDGQGSGHAGCAKKCIESGLPVAIKVGDQLYLASMGHDPANKSLADKAGQQVTVEGQVYEKDGQKLITISKID